MSDSLNRRIVTYPKPNIAVKVKDMANKQGTTVSKVVQTALKEYFKDK